MDVLLFIAGAYVVWMALVGYAFGQLIYGNFSLVDTATCISALLTVLSAVACRGTPHCRKVVAILCAISLGCVALGAEEYYRLYDSPGNDYAWDIRVPFILCLIVVGAAGVFIQSDHRPNTSLERTRGG
jgi:hypothetical protein